MVIARNFRLYFGKEKNNKDKKGAKPRWLKANWSSQNKDNMILVFLTTLIGNIFIFEKMFQEIVSNSEDRIDFRH